MKTKITACGYTNISEYIRDLLRRDLKLEKNDTAEEYPYDYAYIEQLRIQAVEEYKNNQGKELTNMEDLLS